MAIVGIELETFDSESDALTARPLPCANSSTLDFISAVKCIRPDYRTMNIR